MGTTYNIKYVPSESFPIEREIVQQKINDLLFDFNKIASTYDTDSEISHINQMDKNLKHHLSPIMKLLMIEAFEMNKLSNGVFDSSLSPLINLWGFGSKGRRNQAPNEKEVMLAKSACGMKNFLMEGDFISKNNPKSELDFSAFAKGYGVDLVVFYLESIQMDDFFVEIGGEIKTRSSLKQWKIGIEKPDPTTRGQITKVLTLKNGALATSGDYRNFYTDGGKKYSHGINFRSGRPIENNIASVSVFDPDSTMRADAWATALMVSENLIEAQELIKKNNLAAFIVYRNDEDLKTYESEFWVQEFQE